MVVLPWTISNTSLYTFVDSKTEKLRDLGNETQLMESFTLNEKFTVWSRNECRVSMIRNIFRLWLCGGRNLWVSSFFVFFLLYSWFMVVYIVYLSTRDVMCTHINVLDLDILFFKDWICACNALHKCFRSIFVTVNFVCVRSKLEVWMQIFHLFMLQ